MIAASDNRRSDVAFVDDTRLLPLSDAAYLVLLNLEARRVFDPESVDSVAEEVMTRGLSAGSLRTTLGRLLELGLVTEVGGRAGGQSGERRYRLTELGGAALYAEAERRRP